MPMYEYVCRFCRLTTLSSSRNEPTVRCECGNNTWKRKWSVNFGTVMHSHMDSTTGKLISDPKQFKNELRAKSDEMSERTGLEHDYQPVDPHDTSGLKVTEDGLRETYDRKVRTGEIERSTSWL